MKKIFLIIYIFSLVGCAVIVAPPGGPKDTTPPQVLETYPNNYATNFNDEYISIQFDKYMNKSSVIQSFSVIPEIKYDYSWSGKKLKIKFLDELDPNVTYVAKLNTNYSDFKGNKPASALTFIFTKSDKIDKGKIVGKLLAKKPEGKMIFAWRDKDIPIDITTKPDYNVSVGSSGDFELIGLKKGLYRVIAIDDKFKDGKYDSGFDDFGATQYDVEVLDSGYTNIKLKIGPAFDRSGPGLSNVYPISNNILQVNLTEEIYTDNLKKDNFSILNSELNIKNVFANDYPLTKKIYLLFEEKIDTSTVYQLKLSNLKDTLDNPQIDSLSTSEFSGIDKDYVKNIELLTSKIENKIYSKSLKFIFNHPLSEIKDSAAVIFNKKDSIYIYPKVNISEIANVITVNLEDLSNENQYSLDINLSKIIDFKSTKGQDSVKTFNFTYLESKGKSKIKGSVLDSTNCNGKILVQLKLADDIVQQSYLKDSKFEFENLAEANYTLEIICDENENQKYDYGNDIPFNYSEVFYLYDKDIKVKENWDVEDIKIILK